ncbi:DEKNAAC100694 [Brettanomyces naardenensis]|uniref:DEKNAAC100694 n=1 Tax=Brettanomyces naardenensis TaxID=13370 RepID=A0A448YFG7_BRENA|nr:DEKNAAC100694 [Brettanomyces naardenensis]
MLHTPPTKRTWAPEAAVRSSYNAEDGLYSSGDDASGGQTTMKSEGLKQKPTGLIDKAETGKEDDSEETRAGDIDSFPDKDKAQNSDVDTKQIEKPSELSERTEDNTPTLLVETSSSQETVSLDSQTGDTKPRVQKKDDPTLLDDTFEIPAESDLPLELLREYDTFLKYLKEPRFARPLATCEIADLFQRFYRKFSARARNLVYNGSSKQTVELSEYDRPRDYLYYKYNLLAERLVCDKFYSSIMFPKKGISIDDYVRRINDDLAIKLACLQALDIKFRHLDIDLPESEERNFVDQLHQCILPTFELFTSERSPTLKMKYLYKVHKILSDLIQRLEATQKDNYFAMNTDIYLPVLIYTVIQLEDLRTHSLVSQLNFMKRFADEHVYELEDETYRDEKGKLLYVLTNFEACISYLASVTLSDLRIEPPGDETDLLPDIQVPREQILDLLTKPLEIQSIDDETKKYKQANALPRSRSSSYFSSFQQTPLSESIYHADQGIRNISKSVDASLKSIMGRVPWISMAGAAVGATESDEDLALKQQLEENVAFQQFQKTGQTVGDIPAETSEEHKITPVSSASTGSSSQLQNNNSRHRSTVSLNSNGSRTKIDEANVDRKLQASVQPLPDVLPGSQIPPERLLSRFTNTVGSAMKNFLPASANSSSTSLNAHLMEPAISEQGNTGNAGSPRPGKTAGKVRSRAASLMSGSFFGNSGSPQRISRSSSMQQFGEGSNNSEHRPGILNSLESALENVKNRSRGNSLGEPPQLRNIISSGSLASQNGPTMRSPDRTTIYKKFSKPFEDMSVSELKEMYRNYQALVNDL